MDISATQVKELRGSTGAGLMACKSALQEAKGNLDEAVRILRTSGLAAAAKKSGRAAAEGAVGSYIHAGGRIGVMVEVNCETDFVAKNKDFQAMVRDIAMHVAATNPRFLRREDVSEEEVGKERSIYREQALASGKPEKILDRIVKGKLDSFFRENCLLEQQFVKDPDRTIQEVVHQSIVKLGENMSIRRFVRFGLGEGLEKRKNDFAAEVSAQTGA
ncbi:MAG: translation elongation factor Ts [Acidobacteria bacterium]|nr:MAG: translation elongation factor Ts [Acidobacteriota bacterium]